LTLLDCNIDLFKITYHTAAVDWSFNKHSL